MGYPAGHAQLPARRRRRAEGPGTALGLGRRPAVPALAFPRDDLKPYLHASQEELRELRAGPFWFVNVAQETPEDRFSATAASQGLRKQDPTAAGPRSPRRAGGPDELASR